MRRRLTLAGNESLELLLDTICNTFGGIIFISLLVVILLNASSDVVSSTPPTRQSQAELIKTDIQRERLTRDLRELKNALVQQQKIVSSIVSEEVLQAARQTERLQAEHSRLLMEKSKTIGATSAAQQTSLPKTRQTKIPSCPGQGSEGNRYNRNWSKKSHNGHVPL